MEGKARLRRRRRRRLSLRACLNDAPAWIAALAAIAEKQLRAGRRGRGADALRTSPAGAPLENRGAAAISPAAPAASAHARLKSPSDAMSPKPNTSDRSTIRWNRITTTRPQAGRPCGGRRRATDPPTPGATATAGRPATPRCRPRSRPPRRRPREYYDALLRAKAEAENARRRAQEDVAKAHKFGIENFAESMLPVMDSLQAALVGRDVRCRQGPRGRRADAKAAAGAPSSATASSRSLRSARSSIRTGTRRSRPCRRRDGMARESRRGGAAAAAGCWPTGCCGPRSSPSRADSGALSRRFSVAAPAATITLEFGWDCSHAALDADPARSAG